jgi:hypothetical protein
VIVALFTDHNAFAAYITLRRTYVDRGPSYWKLNTRVLNTKSTKKGFASQWERWKRYNSNFPTASLWCKLAIRTKIRSFFKQVSAEIKEEANYTTELFYSCINELITKDKVTKEDYQQIKLQDAHIKHTETQSRKIKNK